jgi:hypothetical protein
MSAKTFCLEWVWQLRFVDVCTDVYSMPELCREGERMRFMPYSIDVHEFVPSSLLRSPAMLSSVGSHTNRPKKSTACPHCGGSICQYRTSTCFMLYQVFPCCVLHQISGDLAKLGLPPIHMLPILYTGIYPSIYQSLSRKTSWVSTHLHFMLGRGHSHS